MLLGAIFRCLDPVLTIGAILSYRSPFVSIKWTVGEETQSANANSALDTGSRGLGSNLLLEWMPCVQGRHNSLSHFLSQPRSIILTPANCQEILWNSRDRDGLREKQKAIPLVASCHSHRKVVMLRTSLLCFFTAILFGWFCALVKFPYHLFNDA